MKWATFQFLIRGYLEAATINYVSQSSAHPLRKGLFTKRFTGRLEDSEVRLGSGGRYSGGSVVPTGGYVDRDITSSISINNTSLATLERAGLVTLNILHKSSSSSSSSKIAVHDP